MFAKISKYAFEIIAGIAIFVAIIYFLPSSKVEIPDIGDLALSGVALDFVMDEDQWWLDTDIDTWSIVNDTWSVIDILSWDTQTWTVDTWMIAFEPIEEPVIVEPTNTEILPIVIDGKDPEPIVAPVTNTQQQNCSIPRWWSIRHGESVLAYQQRSDDPATCNVQRRVCNDGILNGSYTQSSCKELLWFNTQKQEVVTYNVPSSNPYIQPTQPNTINDSSSSFTSTIPPTTPLWGGSYAWWSIRPKTNPITTSTSSSTVRDGTVCTTPRGEEVRNGQFVKAYKIDKWFSNLPCEVELRYCVQTNLEWSFQYESCQHYDIAVEDYMIGHYDPNTPSAMQLAEILHQSADIEPSSWENQTLWDRVKWFVKNIFN